ncbi:MAG: hypothetical protein FWC54_01685, partial [Actinomycetia bacterium]|nr:hypothetical protein [Actinomycetes bacterium]
MQIKKEGAALKHRLLAALLSVALLFQMIAPMSTPLSASAAGQAAQAAQETTASVSPTAPAANQQALPAAPLGISPAMQTIAGTDDSLTVKYGNGTAFTDVDTLTPTPNAASWDISSGSRQLQVQANFANQGVAGTRTLTVTIPRGFKILAYSAKSGTPDITNVSKLAFSTESDEKVASSTLTALDGSSFAGQQITGYTGFDAAANPPVFTSADVPYHNMDGKVVYQFNSNCDSITLTFTIALDPLLFPYNAASTVLPNITVGMISGTNVLSDHLTITATGLIIPSSLSPFSTTPNNGYSRQVPGVVNASDSSGNTGTVPAFTTGITYYSQNSIGSLNHYAESVVFQTTYPAGVQFQGFDLGQMGGTWWSESHPTASNSATYANGHLKVVVTGGPATGGTVTYTFTNTFAVDTGGGSLIRSYWTATVDNSTIRWNGVLPFSTTMNSSSGALVGNLQAQAPRTAIVNITVVKPKVQMTLAPVNGTRRDLSTPTPINFDQQLGSFLLNNIGPSQPENITYIFDFPNSPQVRGVNLPTIQNSDRAIIATGRTNTGRTVTYTGSVGGGSYYGMALTPQMLGLASGEYLTHLEVKQATLGVLYYNLYSYSPAAINYFGRWVNGQEGDVKLTITDSGGATLVQATDHTTIGWANSGAGILSTYTITPAGHPASTFYPGDMISFTATYTAGVTIANTDTIDPDIYINLPAGIDLDVNSVSAQSPAGNHGTARFALQLAGITTKTINGVVWTSYHFKTASRFDIVALPANQSNNVAGSASFNLQYNARVSPACVAYPALFSEDIVQLDLGKTAVNGTGSSAADFTLSDTPNWTGKGTTYKVVGAIPSPNIAVVQLPGFNVSLGIRTLGSNVPF